MNENMEKGFRDQDKKIDALAVSMRAQEKSLSTIGTRIDAHENRIGVFEKAE